MAINRSTLRLLRRLQVSIGTEADAAVRSLTHAWARSWDELSGAWQSGVSDAVAKAAATGTWPSAWELARTERLRQATIASEEALLKLAAQTGITVADGAGQVIATTADLEPALIASQLPAAEQAAAAARFAATVAPTALSAMVARTQSQIVATSRPLSGAASEAMRRELIKGIAVGANPRQAASAMVARVQGAFEGGLVRAVNVARTEMLDAYRATSAYAHAANADVVTGWVWHAQLDARTCPSCWSQHGNVYPLDVPGPWDHQQGRCARLPKTKSWRELGFNIDEPADTIVNARDRFFSLPAAQQRTIMGPGRLELLRSGRVDWADLAGLRTSKEWRPSYAPSPVRDLERLGRTRAPSLKVAATPRATLSSGVPGAGGGVAVPTVTVRPVLAQAGSTRALGHAVEAEAKRLTGRSISVDFHGHDLQVAREHAEGVLRVLETFPQVQLSVRALPVGNPKAYAQTSMGSGQIRFNAAFAGDPVRYRNALANDGARQFHLRFETTPAGTGAHEASHAVHGQFNEQEISRRVSRLLDAQAKAAGLPVEDYVVQELGRYSVSHMRELVAAASADALLAGTAASPLSRGVLLIMRDLHAAGPMRAAGAAVIRPSVGVDLSKLTVAQLKDLAKARQITVPARARKADIVALLDTPSAAGVDAAVARQTAITARRAVADPLAQVAQLLGDEVPPRVLAARAQAILAATTGETRRALTPLVRALRTGDPAKVARAVAAAERKAGLRRVGSPGEVAGFDRKAHTAIGDETVKPGAQVRVLRPGYDITLDGEELRLARATVEPLTAAEIRDIEKRALRAAARERNRQIERATGTAKLLAHVDELIAKKADLAAIRKVLDPKLIEPGSLFANADAAILAALRKAADGGVTTLRAAVTRASTKAKIKPISKAGTKVKFDPDTMESFAGDIKAGTQVTVVTRGSSVTLPDGTVLQLTKAQVVVVRSSAETVQAGDFAGLKRVGAQGGSNPGGIFQAEDGSKWYIKASTSEQWSKEQALASALYREAGLVSPEITVGTGVTELGTGSQTATRIIEGVTQTDITGAKFLAQARKGFATDAWLADWDIGQHGNMVSLKGQPIRMDIGGSLRFRARGGSKGSGFGDSVTEWLTMRDTRNVSGMLFKDITLKDLEASVKSVEAITPERIQALVKQYGLDKPLADTLIARRADLIKRLQDELDAAKPKVFEKGANHLTGPDRGANLAKEVVKLRKDFANKAADPMLRAIAHLQGFHEPPQVVTKAQMTKLINEGHVLMYRGVSGVRDYSGSGVTQYLKTAAQIQEELRTGEAYYGLGIYGNGYYFSTVRATSAGSYSDGTPGSIVRATIRKDAKTIDSDAAYKQWQKWQRDNSTASDIFSDVGRWAAAQGYDVIIKDFSISHSRFSRGEQYYIVLNRSVLIVEKAPTPRAAKA